jgi:hypothetical protein
MSWNKYPYTDFHELNLDWIINKVKELNDALDAVKQEAIDAATEAAREYIDQELTQIETDFTNLQNNFTLLKDQFTDLSSTVDTFTANFTAEINALRLYVDDQLTADRLQMTLLISQNNEYLLGQMETYLANVKVLNYFTGERVSIQDMFNYLSMLHLSDSIDYDTMAYRAKTYTQLAALAISYTNLAMHGNTLYV